MISGKIEVVSPSDVEWAEMLIEQIGRSFYVGPLLDEPETGMGVALLRYPAGLTNPHHTHPCGHGMYILEGKLVTHRGEFGPGTFVWFPEGEPMQHGASPEGDMVALFITNKPFNINYVVDNAYGALSQAPIAARPLPPAARPPAAHASRGRARHN